MDTPLSSQGHSGLVLITLTDKPLSVLKEMRSSDSRSVVCPI